MAKRICGIRMFKAGIKHEKLMANQNQYVAKNRQVQTITMLTKQQYEATDDELFLFMYLPTVRSPISSVLRKFMLLSRGSHSLAAAETYAID